MYGGPLNAFQTIATKEGWRTFYKGASTILVGVPSTALYFSTYETTKRLFPGIALYSTRGLCMHSETMNRALVYVSVG